MTDSPTTTRPGTDAVVLDNAEFMMGRRLWPTPNDAAARPVVVAAAVLVIVTMVMQPYSTVGVAGVVTGIALLGVPAAVVATDRAAARRLLQPMPLLAFAAALALLAVGTFRAAEWLYALCVVTALWLISYAVSAGRRWPAVLIGGAVGWAGVVRGRSWFARGVRLAAGSAAAFLASAKAAPSGESAAKGDDHGDPEDEPMRLGMPAVLLLTVVVLVVFGSLFASADDEFGSIVSNLVVTPSPSWVGRLITGLFAASFGVGLAYAARRPPRLDRLATSEVCSVRPYEWATPVVALVLLFATFAGVQFAVLFGGEQHLRVTEGLTFAEYARSGFGELVVVSVLTLGVLAAVARWAPRGTSSQRNLVRVLAGSICVFSLVIVASALYRTDLYTDAYGLTRLRLVVTTFELWLGLVFVLVLIAGVRLRAVWLPRAVVGAAVAALLGLVAVNPDAYIAERNVARFEVTGKIDTFYLSNLSADAVPVLTRLSEPERSCALEELRHELAADDGIAAYNVSRDRARAIVSANPAGDEDPACVARY